MLQEIIIGLIFFAALGYVGHLIFKSFQAKHACSSGCGKCSAVDLAKIEQSLIQKVNHRSKESADERFSILDS